MHADIPLDTACSLQTTRACAQCDHRASILGSTHICRVQPAETRKNIRLTRVSSAHEAKHKHTGKNNPHLMAHTACARQRAALLTRPPFHNKGRPTDSTARVHSRCIFAPAAHFADTAVFDDVCGYGPQFESLKLLKVCRQPSL